MGPKALRRAARWADGVDLGPDEESVQRAFRRACQAWSDAGRDRPRLVTSAWIAPGPDGCTRLEAYVRRYLDFLGPDFAEASATACHVDSEDALHAAIDAVRAAGANEFLLASITADTDELERIIGVVREANHRRA